MTSPLKPSQNPQRPPKPQKTISSTPLEDPFTVLPPKPPRPPTPSLFYAYAHSIDPSSSPSTYLLTFASAPLASEWFFLFESAYPEKVERSAAQLFSLTSPSLLSKATAHQDLQHLKGKWFHTPLQHGATPIPLQDEEGRLLMSHNPTPTSTARNSSPGYGDTSKILQSNLRRMQELVERNASHIRELAELAGLTLERMERIETLVEANSEQIHSLADTQTASLSRIDALEQEREGEDEPLAEPAQPIQLVEILQQNTRAIGELSKQMKRLAKAQTVSAAASVAEKEDGGAACEHDVRPPPIKLDRPIVGYVYGQKSDGSGINTPRSGVGGSVVESVKGGVKGLAGSIASASGMAGSVLGGGEKGRVQKLPSAVNGKGGKGR